MSIARNTAHNLAGALTPMAVSLITVPLYLHQIGEARYGVLAIVWLLLGYFGLFDLGLSRATANFIAQLPATSAEDREEVFWTACILNAGFGLLGGFALYLAGGPLLGQWFKMSPALHAEALTALPWIAAAVPVATLSAVLTGALEGQERFGVVNTIQAAGTILFQVFPLAAAFAVSPRLSVIVPVAVGVRVLSALPLAVAAKVTLPIAHGPRVRMSEVRRLLGYGAWVTVTKIIGPILESLDRFLIGIVLGASAVAYYVVPFNVVNRARVLPGALSRALFPRFSAQSGEQTWKTAVQSVKVLQAIMTPLIIAAIFIVRPFITLWLGESFAQRAVPVAQILLVGIWINSMALVPFALLQAQGRPDLVAKFHLAQLGPFIILLWWLLHNFGLNGAALAWTLRVSGGATLQFLFSRLGNKVWPSLCFGGFFILAAWTLASSKGVPSSIQGLGAVAMCLVSAIWSLKGSPDLRARLLTTFAHAVKT